MKIEFSGNVSDFLKIGGTAAGRGNVDAMREILKQRPKWLHQLGSHGRTLLWEASHKGKLEMVKYLVRRKANIDAVGTHYTPYFVEVSCYCIARHKRHHDVADYLLSKGAELNIHTAAFLGDLDGVQAYVRKKPRLVHAGHPQHEMLDKDDPRGNFALERAAWATPLCYALRGGTAETVEFLLRKKSKVTGRERELYIAVDDDVKKLELLFEHGADPQLYRDVHPDEGELFKLLTKYGKKAPKSADSSELVYLCRGDRGGNPEEVRRLLRLGAEVNFQDHKGKTALHRAGRSGFTETIQILLEAGANPDIPDPAGETAIFDTVRSTIKNFSKQKEAVRLILRHGASLAHKNKKKQTALDVAKTLKTDKRAPLTNMLRRKQKP